MLLYRVFPFVRNAPAGHPGHPLYEHRPQRGGRIDHPDYFVWYLANQASGAIGETFGNLAKWESSMFDFPLIPGARRVLGTFWLPDDLRLLDLDDPVRLVELGLRPTQVVARNLAVTQNWAHKIWASRDPHDRARKRWQAVQWWSYHRPVWQVLGSWLRPEFVTTDELELDSPWVVDAAKALTRTSN